jgi:PIN domain
LRSSTRRSTRADLTSPIGPGVRSPSWKQSWARGGAPGQLRPGVTIEVPIDSGPRVRPVDADEEILATCREFRQLTGREVTLVTGDTSMRMRAQARAIAVVKVPERYERKRTSSDSSV